MLLVGEPWLMCERPEAIVAGVGAGIPSTRDTSCLL
jgi:hypothetical protein